MCFTFSLSDLLSFFIQGEAKIGNGYKGKSNPHTKYEQFEGLTIKDAVDVSIILSQC